VAAYTDNPAWVAEADLAGGPGLRLLEVDIQHVGLNIVCVGGDGDALALGAT
jgi:hypothetical protein